MRIAKGLVRLLVRMYPREFRVRYGAEIEAALERASRERRASGIRLVMDSVFTLVRVWRDRPGGGGNVEERRRFEWRGTIVYAWRGLRRDPVHALVSALTLAIAIGANAAIFSVAYSVLLRTLPYDAPERTVHVEPAPIRISRTGAYEALSALTTLPGIERVATYTGGGSGNLHVADGAEPVVVTHVDGVFFSVLGARMHLGRPITTDGSGEAEVVLSYGVWQRMFGGDPSVIGRTIHLTQHALTVVGVAAAEVEYPAGTDVWLSYPVRFDLMGMASSADVIARIARVEDIERVRAAHESRMRTLSAQNGETFSERSRPAFTPLRSSLVGPIERSLWLLLGASALVLLLGCFNLAGLSLARITARRGEFAVRRALGAGTSRLAGIVVTESMLIAVIAGLGSLAFVVWGRALLERMLPPELPGLGAGPGAETIALIVGLAIVCGLAVSLLPALHAARAGASYVASAAGRIMDARHRVHPTLVVAQIALAVLLVVCAGLLARSVFGLRSVALGFDTDRIVTFEARLPWAEAWDTAVFRRFAHGVRDNLLERPGVIEVGIASRLPLSESMGVAYRVWPDGTAEDGNQSAVVYPVSASYFDALGIRFLAGQTFTEQTSVRTAILSRTTAERTFGRTDVVGQSIRARISVRAEPARYVIAGVVNDVRASGFTGDPGPALYLPFDAQPSPSMAFAVRANRDARDIVPLIRGVVREADPAVAPFAVQTMQSAANAAIAAQDALALVSALFGAMALLLAVLGIYGLVAQGVIRRRREMGLRLAVGARSTDLARLVLRNALALAALGIGVGLVLALGTTRFIASFLFGINAADMPTYALVAVAALAAVLVACLVPARRAARTDPLESLRAG